jgi:lipoic acid synthetase
MNPLKKKARTKFEQTKPELPEWLKVKLQFPKIDSNVNKVRETIATKKLNTVCESASCPNLNHCWSRKTATYMIAGDICTRRCAYCDVAFGKPGSLDREEPNHIAQSVKDLELRYVVITSVNRDDLKDGGANHFAETIFAIRNVKPDIHIEVLIPDFKGKKENLEIIYKAKPDIINHNIETVERLFPFIAPAKNYSTSLDVLTQVSKNQFIAKSGLILGLGETLEEVKKAIYDLKEAGVSMLTIGQYMQPTKTHYPVVEYVHPDIFKSLKDYAKSLGYKHVESGPLVRSSYHADEQSQNVI